MRSLDGSVAPFTFESRKWIHLFRLRVKRSLRNLCLVVLGLGACIQFAQGASLILRGSYPFDFSATEMLFDEPRACTYVADFSGHSVLKVSLTNGAVLAQLTFTNRPLYGTVSPNRQRLYFSLQPDEAAPDTGSIVEINLNTFGVTTSFPVSVTPTFLVATDSRLVVVAGGGPGFPRTKCYSAANSSELDSIGGGVAGYGSRLTMHPSLSALYVVPLDGFSPARCVELRRFNSFTGDISYPSPFFDGSNAYCSSDFSIVTASWMLPGGTRLLLDNGDVLNVAADPVVVSFRQRLEQIPAHLAGIDFFNQALFTVSLNPPSRLHQFHLSTLDYGSGFDLTNSGTHYWIGPMTNTLWLGRVDGGRTFVEAYANPAVGGATNRPPVPQIAFTPAAPTTTNVIVFDATQSRDENTLQEELVFRWDWDNDGSFDTPWQQTPIATHQFNVAGTNVVIVQVRDRFGLKGNSRTNVFVEFAPDAGHAPDTNSQPFVLPFAISGGAFHPQRPLLYALQASSNRLVSVNLSNGLVEREFSFNFPPQIAALSPDGQRLFVGLTGLSGTNGYVAEFQAEPLIKIAEWASGLAPQLISATDTRLVVIAGVSGALTCVRAFSAASQSGGNCVALTLGAAGLATSTTGDEVYVADEAFFAKVSWRAPLDSFAQIDSPVNFPEECGTGEFLVLPRNDWIVRSSGVICTPQSEVVSNFDHYAFALAADNTRDAFVTMDGNSRLHAFHQSDAGEFGSYKLQRLASLLGVQDGRVYAVGVNGEQTFIERRLLPAADSSNNVPPMIEVIAPTNHLVVQDGETVAVTVRTLDLDGTVTNAMLFVDGELLQPIESDQPVYWTATPSGVHTLLAIAMDDFGAVSTSSIVEVVVNFPPSIRLASPVPDEELIVPATVLLAAEAVDPDGRIERVDFYRDYLLFATVTNPPFAVSFIESNRTYHVYSAVATDDTGARAATPDQFNYYVGLPGDDILDAFGLGSTNSYVTNISNLTATREKLEPLHAGKAGNHSMWWQWTAPVAGSLVVSTRGSSFDTLLAAYTGPVYSWAPFAGLIPLVGNDDDAVNAPASRLKFDVQAGVIYHLAADGYGEASGEIVFTLDFLPFAVTNDFLAGAIGWTGETNYAGANNIAATREPGEPFHAGNSGGHSLWWAWYHDAPGYVTLSTEGSSLDTLLAVYVHNGIGPLDGGNLLPIASNDDDPRGGRTSWIRFPNVAWQTYYIAVDGYNGASGDLRLSLSWEPTTSAPINDDFRDAVVLSGVQTTATALTSGATKEPGELPHAGNVGGHSVWWRWTAPADGPVTVSTKGSNFDTLLGIYTGNDVSSLTLVSANDDDPLNPPTSFTQFTANNGCTYWVAVDGYNGSSGRASLTLHAAEGPAPRITSIQLNGNICELRIDTETVEWLAIETSTNLHDWLSIITNRVSSGSNIISIPISPSTPAQFFRAFALP